MLRRLKALERATRTYAESLDHSQIQTIQLESVKAQWERALSHSFYQWWQREHDLPSTIESLQQLRQFPLLTKAVLRENLDLVFRESNRARFYTTGGTTAEPTLFPAARYEAADRWADNYVGRRWWGIESTDKCFLVWGHSHLYGTGHRRIMNLIKRRVLDRVTRTLRVDGYVTAPERVAIYVNLLLRFQPSHVVGYSTALARLAGAATEEQAEQIRSLSLKGAIATAERIDDHDRALIERVLGCPVVSEYGAAETGVLAVSRGSTDNMVTMWRSHLLTNDADHGSVVTTLRRRQFPLIQYALDDQVDIRDMTTHGSVLAIKRVFGRTLDVLKLSAAPDVLQISALQLTHMIKGHPAVRALQFSQPRPDEVMVHAHLDSRDDANSVKEFLDLQLRRDYPNADRDKISVVYEPDQMKSRAGKHLVIRPTESDGVN